MGAGRARSRPTTTRSWWASACRSDARQDGRVPTRVLFVCSGNICRSPTAEAVMRRLVDEAGLSDEIEVDGAGTGGWHVGDPPDPRARAAAARRGIELTGQARQIEPD